MTDEEFEVEEEHVDAVESMHREHFTPKELASLLDTSVSVIEAAAVRGELKVYWADHHIVDIRRSDVLSWLEHNRD